MNKQTTEGLYHNLTDTEELVENGETNLERREEDSSVYMVVNTGRSHTDREWRVLRALVAVLAALSVVLLIGHIVLLTQKIAGQEPQDPLAPLPNTKGQDMQDQKFCFPKHTDTDYVKVELDYDEPLTHLSFCMRYKTKYGRKEQSLFSLATPDFQNAFLLFIERTGKFSFTVNHDEKYTSIISPSDQWNSVCVSWSSCGPSYLWLNDRKLKVGSLAQGDSIQTHGIALIGQDQDSHGGHLDLAQCFVGVASDIYLWGQDQSTPLVADFMHGKPIPYQRNLLIDWRALNYTLSGDVSVRSSTATCTEA